MLYIDQTMSKITKTSVLRTVSQIRLLYKVATALSDWFFNNRDGVCLLRGTNWIFKCNVG